MPADLLATLLPLACPGCGVAAEPICPECAAGLNTAPPAPAPVGVDAWFAAFAYEGVARELVARVKYRGAHAVVGWLAAEMALLVPPPLPEVVTWAPTTPARRRERGFDHAELLARAVGRLVHRRPRRLLSRAPGRPQTGQPVAARRVGPTFAARGRAPAGVLLVDDIATTGATVATAAAALRVAGAERVVALTAARTPP